MSVGKIRGIVLKEQQSGESSKYMVVLAKGAGKLRLNARGAKKAKSPLLAGTQLFSYSDFTVYAGRGFGTVTQADLIENFYGLRNDVAVLSQAVYLTELVERVCPDDMEQDGILRLLLTTLQLLAKGKVEPLLAGRIFEIKLLQLSGLLGTLDCDVCGAPASAFSPAQACFVCAKHTTKSDFVLSEALSAALMHVLEKEGTEIFSFRLSPKSYTELDRLLHRYLQVHTGLDLQSRRFAADICF